MNILTGMLICLALIFYEIRKSASEQEFGNQELFIINGEEAVMHEWPWQVSIQKFDFGIWDHTCGGSLIHPQWILSAAHCFPKGIKLKELKIVLGNHYTRNLTRNMGKMEERNIVKIFPHPNYETVHHSSDIGVVKMDSPVKSSNIIQLVTLSKENEWLLPGVKVVVTGWGVIFEAGEFFPDKTYSYGGRCSMKGSELLNPTYHVFRSCGSWYGKVDNNKKYVVLGADALQKAHTTIMSYEKCFTFFGKPRNFWDSFICSSEEDAEKGFCVGDSGGPMVTNEDGHWVQYGVVSHYDRPYCGSAKKPNVYTRVSNFIKWIKDTIAKN